MGRMLHATQRGHACLLQSAGLIPLCLRAQCKRVRCGMLTLLHAWAGEERVWDEAGRGGGEYV